MARTVRAVAHEVPRAWARGGLDLIRRLDQQAGCTDHAAGDMLANRRTDTDAVASDARGVTIDAMRCFAIAVAVVLPGCAMDRPQHEMVQEAPRYDYGPAVAADVHAMSAGMAAAQARWR